MTMTRLLENLRSLSESFDEEYLDFWVERIAPLLPGEPLTPEFLDETLAPLSIFDKTRILEFLSRLGRAEVANTAAALVGAANGFEKLELATALLECDDPRGYETLDALHRHSLDHRDDDKVGTVPPDWITEDILRERIGTSEALKFRLSLLAREREHRERGTPPPSVVEPDPARFLLEPVDAIPLGAPLLADDNPRHFWLLSNGGTWKLALGQNIGGVPPEIRAVYQGTLFVALYHGTAAAIRPGDGRIISMVKLVPGNGVFWYDYGGFVTAEGELEVGVFTSQGQFLWKASLGDVIEIVDLKENGIFEMVDASGHLGRYEALSGRNLPTMSKVPFQAGNHHYSLEVRRSGEKDFSMGCGSQENSTPVVCTVVSTLFVSHGFSLLRALDDHTDRSLDDVGFTYEGESEDHASPGPTFFAFDDEETVSAEFFEQFVIAFGFAYLAAMKETGLESSERLRLRLKARQLRPGAR